MRQLKKVLSYTLTRLNNNFMLGTITTLIVLVDQIIKKKEVLKMKEMNELFEIADEMEQLIGTEEMLLSLLKQMTETELREALKFLDRIHDTNLFE